MKKVLSLIAILCMALVFFAGCDLFPQSTTEKPCEHKWIEATCVAAKTCSVCGATEGEPDSLNHRPEEDDGDCTTAVKCANEGCDEIIVAALNHAPETDDGDCTTEVKCTNEGCDEIIVAAALNHTPEADDGDVTTAVKCANEGCQEILEAAREAITLTIPTFENGAVITDKMNYAIGDTVKLTINPELGYAQKLYIDGEPLMLDWNNNIYSFVADKDTYVISGTFEQSLNLNPADITRWEIGNQAHGVISTRYTTSGHNNESYWFDFNGNYSSISVKAKNYFSLEDSKDGDGNIGFSFVLRINLDNGKFYAFRIINDNGRYAFDKFGASGSATGWGNWQALNAEAAGALNSDDGVDFKLARTGENTLTLYVNGSAIFTYTMEGVTAENKVTSVGWRHYGNIDVQVDIPFELTLGCEHDWKEATCTEPKTCSKCNWTVGEALKHSFTKYETDKLATCEEYGTETAKCDRCEETHTRVVEVYADHKDADTDYICDVCDQLLCTNHTPAEDDGDCTTEIKCTICGTVTTEAKGSHTPEADDEDIATAVKCSNDGCNHICVPAIVISAFENGTVTADKTSYNVGDTVTLTVAPASGYAQKLYINGDPILVDTNSKYSFVVKEGETYNITGEFVSTQGKWFWTAEYGMLNQAHGIFHSPAPGNDKQKNGELVPTADKCYGGKVLVKDPSGGTKQDFAIVLKMTFSDGQKAELRLVNKEGNGKYMIQSMSGMFGSWKWYYDLNDAENAAVANGEGVWFELVRKGSNIDIKLNGKVIPHRTDTPISLAETTVLNQFKVTTYNFSYAIDVKYEFYMTE